MQPKLEDMIAEIAMLGQLRKRCAAGSEWATWIDERIAWLKRKLEERNDLR
jgi:ABC-type Fe3+-hydroxamate transport system substrate-binding protein